MFLLADAPALPLHEAGKYVAGAYVVFVMLILIYVAIMAVKLQRIEKELSELAAKRTSASLARLRRAFDGEGARRPGTPSRPTATVPARAAQS